MIVVGLTGSIGTGKSTTAAMFREYGASVQSADEIVHTLLNPGGKAVAAITRLFPYAIQNGVVDRKSLGDQVFISTTALRRLESVLHPLVSVEREKFLKQCERQRVPLVILDVPLLFETALDQQCDLSILVTAPSFVQKMRVLCRTGMTQEKLSHILSRQMPEHEKCRRADRVIKTGLGKRAVRQQVRYIIYELLGSINGDKINNHA